MKRKFAAILLAILILSGCGANAENVPQTTQPRETEKPTYTATQPTRQTAPPTQTTTLLQTAAPTQTAPVRTTPPPVQTTQTTPPPVQTTPAPTTPPTPTAPPQTVPQQTVPPQTTAAPTTAAAPGRPVSSATCKDLGTDQIWDDPAVYEAENWEVEKDPTRAAYLQYMKDYGNEYYFYIKTDSIRMHLDRVYGIPLETSYEIMMGCTWSCSDPAVAEVNNVGYVVPLSYGTAVITVSYTVPETQEVLSRQCEITVEPWKQYTYAYLEQRAHEEAKLIAEFALNYERATTDLERISVATALVHQYVANGRGGTTYRIVDGELISCSIPGYNQPFGTLVTFRSTCAGDTRALGLVLEYMGFEWFHTNENQWDHQWCVVYDVDGQTAFADCSMYGIVGYGERQEDRSNWLSFGADGLTPFG